MHDTMPFGPGKANSSGARAPVLEIIGLSIPLPKKADRAYAVQDLNLSIAPGQTLCVVGESGSGKSMTAHAVMGLLPRPIKPSAGEIRLSGRDLLQLDEAGWREVRGAEIGMIFQEPMTSLNPLTRIGAQIMETFAVHGRLSTPERKARMLELLDEVGLPEPRRIANAFPHELSGGQRQRVMIAMALALEPKLLIADEPTTALDVTTQAQILALIKDLQRRRGMAVLFITHDFGVVADVADSVAVLQEGRLVEAGPADTVLTTPQQEYTKRLLAAVPSLTPPPPRDLAGARPLLSVKGLRKRFSTRRLFRPGRDVMAVSDVSFVIRSGETLGLVGESGSGKSTVGRCLTRLIEPDAGEIRIGETNLSTLSQRQLRPHRKKIQMVFQDPFASLNPRRTVGQIIAEGPIVQGESQSAAFARARRLLELVGLSSQAFERFPHEFSGGQRQRIGIARALALEPEVLIADEPLSALDVSIQAQILTLIQELQQRLGLAILFVTHDLRVAAQVCDRIAVMQQGRIVELRPTAELFAAPEHDYTRRLLSAVPGLSRLSRPIYAH